jgi:hypothetical protein
MYTERLKLPSLERLNCTQVDNKFTTLPTLADAQSYSIFGLCCTGGQTLMECTDTYLIGISCTFSSKSLLLLLARERERDGQMEIRILHFNFNFILSTLELILHTAKLYAAPYWATLHPTGLHCILFLSSPSHTLLSYAAFCWAMMKPAGLPSSELRCTFWEILHLT